MFASSFVENDGTVPTGVLSIPTRYLHTPTEMVSMSDVENVIELLVKAIEDYR